MLVVRDVAEEAEAQVLAQGDDVHEPAAEEVVTEHVLDTCSALARRVEGLENDKVAQQLEIVKLNARLRRLKKVRTSQRVESLDAMENVFNQGRIIVDMDQDEWIELVVD
nr:hypothetical protein [Tanacetum cinerariifolium]